MYRKSKSKEITSLSVEHDISMPEEKPFINDQEEYVIFDRLETGLFGRMVIVGGLRISLYDGPACFYNVRNKVYDQCNACTFFSPHDCLLRSDEYLLSEIRLYTEAQQEHVEAIGRKRSLVTDTIHKELKAHGRPLHYSVIAKMIIGRYPKFRLTANGIYHYLLWHPELFERVDAGVFRAR